MVQSEKVMLTIVWNPSGLHVIDVLPKGTKFNAGHNVSNVLSPLAIWRRTQMRRSTRKLIVHADNARPHTATIISSFMEQNGMERTIHPAYSPDLAPSDFYLFGDVKQMLVGCEFTDLDELIHAINALLTAIEKVTLEEVFLAWTTRLTQCAALDGVYAECLKDILHNATLSADAFEAM
jgi:histone-lysine N-methyltransferase SETMAR